PVGQGHLRPSGGGQERRRASVAFRPICRSWSQWRDAARLPCLCLGVPNRQRGTIVAPIDRHTHAREKMAVREGGREAVTKWEIVERYKGIDGKPVAALLACQLE